MLFGNTAPPLSTSARQTPVEGPLYGIQLHMDLMELEQQPRTKLLPINSSRSRRRKSMHSMSKGPTERSFCACEL